MKCLDVRQCWMVGLRFPTYPLTVCAGEVGPNGIPTSEISVHYGPGLSDLNRLYSDVVILDCLYLRPLVVYTVSRGFSIGRITCLNLL